MKIADQLAECFVCPKCGSQRGRGRKLHMMSSWGPFLLGSWKSLATVSCFRCGYTDMYDPEMLEGRDPLELFTEIYGR